MKDYLIRVMTTNKEIRALAVNSTQVVSNAQQAHATTPVATAALGRALSAALLMGSMVKTGHETGLKIIGDGPLQKIIAEANHYGEVRGYVANPEVDFITNQAGKLDVARAIGEGELFVYKNMGLKEEYESSVPLVSGEIGEDITYYFSKSEQTPAAVALGVLVDTDCSVKAAGGFIIQLLPEASEETIEQLEKNLAEIKSVSKLIDQGLSPEELLEKVLTGFKFRVLAEREVAYQCKCDRERTKSLLVSLGQQEIEEIVAQEGQVEIRCHFCGEVYSFEEAEVEELFTKVKSMNQLD
ncbi:Hsp33 family molecular chaperone HslO [Fuchsiella alkaliacetigena]|uniref:Hsp33 family molecular chaperone HslO n=1 Tax=Fuchsiella alkaliacetigena TaxID=957042 RepID=UPI00200A9A95|nr:Hsp33 family molecular chaperone HslO [Fuchsiella alkaliacetigena]MCK8825306.1 Hsp33 family molecular chaperone HslO [Fuchsiella alkaliacetigena]